MKQNDRYRIPDPRVPASQSSLLSIPADLGHCIGQFSQENGPSVFDRTLRVAFGNGVYLTLEYPDAAKELLSELLASGIPGNRETIVGAFRDFIVDENWIVDSGNRVTRLFAQETGAEPSHVSRKPDAILFAVVAGITVTTQMQNLNEAFKDQWTELGAESRFLASRLLNWRDSRWQPQRPPFIEFAAGFYTSSACEERAITEAMHEVLGIALATADPWAIGLWADTGWFAGRRVAMEMPELFRELVGEVDAPTLNAYLDLYRKCVLPTLKSDRTVQPEKAALRYFGIAARDIYARTYCRGDQPRYIARAAFDLTYWMGLLSTQPTPT